ncbi:MAG: hypothetical protein EHM78_10385 [Myxococcaceae bacterium]|nr:MAG: hypothetical protein EHM78_10385 [Myxococcaceae bacterium]
MRPGRTASSSLQEPCCAQHSIRTGDLRPNHLDLPTVERLTAALRAYPGALLLVTHDDALADACTTNRWCLEEQRVVIC